MGGEMHNLLMVWCTIFMTSSYCFVITKVIPKGTIRLFMFLPVLCLSLHLPLQLNTITFSILTAFFIIWQTTFKLLLLAFGNGPLCNSSLSFLHFFIIYSLPISLPAQNPKPKRTNGPKSNKIGLRHFTKNALILIFLIYLGKYKDKLPRQVVLFLICIYLYVGLEVILVGVAFIAQVSLGTKIDPPFDDPYLATSFKDFWGRRWNRVSSTSLRSVVYHPTINHTSKILGRKWASFVGLMLTFAVSDIMHEVLFYYLGRVRLGWGPTLFFFLHGLLVSFETMLNVKWRKVPKVICGPLIYGFVNCTFMWLVLPELLELNVDDKVLKEYATFVSFLKEYCIVAQINIIKK